MGGYKLVKNLKDYDPFSISNLNKIFKLHKLIPNRLTSRESSQYEFKESFNWNNRSKYAKTMAAFANKDGGYIIFGIQDSPKNLVGLKNNDFETLDEERITEYLNSMFSPEIIWSKQIYELNGLNFGVLYTSESNVKPVVCKKNDGSELKESDIYYRYNGRSEKIKYPELARLIEREREKEKLLWLRHIEKIANIGPNSIGILDINGGVIEGAAGTLLLDEKLLNEIAFIKEGEFNEKKGKPTLKLIGEVKELSGATFLPTKTKIKGLRTREIYEAVLQKHTHDNTSAIEYIEQLPHEPSKFMPFRFFVMVGKIDDDTFVQTINDANTTNHSLKKGLIERLSIAEDFTTGALDEELLAEGIYFEEITRFTEFISTQGKNSNRIKRTLMLSLLRSDSRDNIFHYISTESKSILEAITHLSKDEISERSSLLSKLLLDVFDYCYSDIADVYRRAICHIDNKLYT